MPHFWPLGSSLKQELEERQPDHSGKLGEDTTSHQAGEELDKQQRIEYEDQIKALLAQRDQVRQWTP
jgi:hypothetical protein